MSSSVRYLSRSGGSRMRRRPAGRYWLGVLFRGSLIIIPLVLLAVGAYFWLNNWLGLSTMGLSDFPTRRPATQIVDPAKLLRLGERSRLEYKLDLLNQRYQMDMMIVLATRVNPDQMRRIGQTLFRQWRVGRYGLGQSRGILLVVAARDNRAYFVVGSDLTNPLAINHALFQFVQKADYLSQQYLPASLKQGRLGAGLEGMLGLIEL